MEVEKRERAAAELSDFPGWPRVGSDGHWAVGIPAFTSGATTGLASTSFFSKCAYSLKQTDIQTGNLAH